MKRYNDYFTLLFVTFLTLFSFFHMSTIVDVSHDIILKPVITENSMAGIADKKYTFKVATDATKVEIAQAVEVLFPGAKVAKVNTISVRGRFRRQGMHAGYTAASKKAIVTLTKDSKEIEFFNSMV